MMRTLCVCCAIVLTFGSECLAQWGTLARPLSGPSPNAALHYQRAMLYLEAIDDRDLDPIEKPILESITVLTDDEVALSESAARLLYQGRLAIKSASVGSRLEACDFGIDYQSHGAATPLPHVGPMARLGRLMTLRGVYELSRGNWEESAVVFFDTIRMGRHLSHQQTVSETLAGMEILTNAYDALCHWSVRCPDTSTVARARRLFETIAVDVIDPAGTVTGELSVLGQRLAALSDAYPDGPWAELILEDLGEPVAGKKVAELREDATKLAIDAGVDAKVFESPEAFRLHLEKLSSLHLRFSESAAACMTLPPRARRAKGNRIYANYAQMAGALGDTLALNPGELGAAFAVHETELTVARLTLAVSSQRSEKKTYPDSLKSVAGIFGGRVPASPYDESEAQYQVLDSGKHFYLSIGSANGFPEVGFSSKVPQPPAE